MVAMAVFMAIVTMTDYWRMTAMMIMATLVVMAAFMMRTLPMRPVLLVPALAVMPYVTSVVADMNPKSGLAVMHIDGKRPVGLTTSVGACCNQ